MTRVIGGRRRAASRFRLSDGALDESSSAEGRSTSSQAIDDVHSMLLADIRSKTETHLNTNLKTHFGDQSQIIPMIYMTFTLPFSPKIL